MLGCCKFLHILASLSNFWKSETNNDGASDDDIISVDIFFAWQWSEYNIGGKIEVLDLK